MILHIFSEFIPNNIHTFTELLPNNTTHIFRHQTVTFSESYWQTILQTFPDFILLSMANTTTHFSGVYIK